MFIRIALSILFSINLTFCNVFSQEGVLSHIENNTSDSLMAVYYENLGLSYEYTNPDSSKFFFEKSLAITRENGFKLMEATILSKIGGSLYILGDYDLSLDYFTSGFKIFKELNYNRGIAVGYNNIGMIYDIQGRNDKAISYHKKSIIICKLINDSTLLATNLFNLGISYEQNKDYDSAIISSNKALLISKGQNNNNQTFMIYNLNGRIYTKMRLFNTAEEMFLKIITATNFNNLWEISYAHSGLATLYQIQKLYGKSINHGKIAYEMAKKLNAKWDIQSSSEILSVSYSESNQFDSAYKYLHISKIYSDSIFNKEKENHINYINLKNAEYQNEKLNKDKINQQQKLDSKNKQIILFTIGLIILFILLIIIILNNKQKRDLNKKLQFQNSEIELKNKELEKLNSTKDLMFRIIAHDLLSPLSTVVSYTDLILKHKKNMNKEEILEIMQKFNVSTNQAYNLLENLLDWAKTQMGEISIYPKPIFIKELVMSVTAIYTMAFNSKDLSFNIDIDEEIQVFADRNMISTVIRNLVSNAIKFTPTGGSISIFTKDKTDNIEIIIADTGVGIEEHDIVKLFDLNPSLTTAGTEGEKGSGIGLMLCKEFVEKANGKIWAESKPGEGTQFHFTLPAMRS